MALGVVFWGGVPADGVLVEVDRVVVVPKVVESEAQEADARDSRGSRVESEAEETEVGDVGGFRTAQAGAGCWVLWARRLRVCVRASAVCARFPSCPVCVQVPVPWLVSSVVCDGVIGSSWMCGLASYPGGGLP